MEMACERADQQQFEVLPWALLIHWAFIILRGLASDLAQPYHYNYSGAYNVINKTAGCGNLCRKV